MLCNVATILYLYEIHIINVSHSEQKISAFMSSQSEYRNVFDYAFYEKSISDKWIIKYYNNKRMVVLTRPCMPILNSRLPIIKSSVKSATSLPQWLPIILYIYECAEKKHFFSRKPEYQSGRRALTTTSDTMSIVLRFCKPMPMKIQIVFRAHDFLSSFLDCDSTRTGAILFMDLPCITGASARKIKPVLIQRSVHITLNFSTKANELIEIF